MLTRIDYFVFSDDVVHKLENRKTAKIRKHYNQVPHLTQDTTLESNKNTINITNKSQEVSPFPAGNHKASMNVKTQETHDTKNTNDPPCELNYCRVVKTAGSMPNIWCQ